MPSGEAGSIGVFVLHTDISRALEKEGVKPTFISAGERKTDANAFEPLTERAKADIQRDVDLIHLQFTMNVGRGRGVSAAHVREHFGQGRMMMARESLRMGLIDQIGNFETALPARTPQRQRIEGGSSLGDILGEALSKVKANG